MFMDDLRARVWNQVQNKGLRVFAQFLSPEVLEDAARVCERRLSANPLNLARLAWLGVACALYLAKNFANVLTITFKLLADSSAFETPPPRKSRRLPARGRKRSKHDPRRADPTMVSEEAFAKARKLMPLGYWTALVMLLADRFAREQAEALRWKRFRLLALDGTLLNLPRRQSLRDHFGAARNQKGGQTPQARLLLLQFPLTRVPYRFALAPKSKAEKTLAASLVAELQANDLLLIDRGFWSFGLFCQIEGQQAFFAIRQIKQAQLKVIRHLGPHDTLVRFAPKDKSWRRQGLPPALTLRRIGYQIRGFRPSALITNVTDPALISRQEWLGLTADAAGQVLDQALYHRRWEIETTFAEMKVRQGLKQLRSRTPQSMYYEIASHVLLYLMVRWLVVQAAQRHGDDPLRLSFTEALREIQDQLPALITGSAQRVRTILLPRLLARIAGHRVPERLGRHYPRPNDTKTRNLGNGRRQLPSKLAG